MSTHIDNFIEEPFGTQEEKYAKWILHHFRLSAHLQMIFKQFMSKHKLFGTYKSKKYRVTGASRLGDVWITSNFNQDTGYDLRVDAEDISNWSAE